MFGDNGVQRCVCVAVGTTLVVCVKCIGLLLVESLARPSDQEGLPSIPQRNRSWLGRQNVLL